MNPWDRLPNESPRAFEAFCTFRDLGPSRSVPEAFRKRKGRQSRRADGTWNLWYRRHDWKARAEAYDAEIDRVRQAKRRDQVEEMVERHARDFRTAEELAATMLRRLAEKSGEIDPTDGATAKAAKTWAAMLDLAAQGERLIGEPLTLQTRDGQAGGGPDSILIDQLVDELVREGRL